MTRSALSAAALLLLLPAALAGQDSAKAKPRIKRTPDVITVEEIDAAPSDIQDAYTLVTRLRPNWLRTRGVGSMVRGSDNVVIYVNEAKWGDPETLRSLRRSGIREMRHLNGAEATQQFGLNHENGAILIAIH